MRASGGDYSSLFQGPSKVLMSLLIRNAEFIEEMIADLVFAEMLAAPEDSGHAHHSHASHDIPSHSSQSLQGHEHAHASETSTHDHNHSSSHSRLSQVEQDQAQDKVRSTLRSFVRDWADEGKEERKQCYDPCLEALERYYPKVGRDRKGIRVLVPGCGLGRLAMEVAAKGQSLSPRCCSCGALI